MLEIVAAIAQQVLLRVTGAVTDALVHASTRLLKRADDGADGAAAGNADAQYSDPASRLAAYQRYVTAVVQLRQQLGVASGLSANPVGALWTWPVYHRAVRQLAPSTEEVLAALLHVQMLAPASVVDAANAAASAIGVAIEWTGTHLARRRQRGTTADPNAVAASSQPWEAVDTAISDFVRAARTNLA